MPPLSSSCLNLESSMPGGASACTTDRTRGEHGIRNSADQECVGPRFERRSVTPAMIEGKLRLREADWRSLCGRQVGVAWQCVRIVSQNVAERRIVVVDHLTRLVAVEWRVHRQHGGQQALGLHDVVDRREHEHCACALDTHRHAAALGANQHPRVDHQLLHLRPIVRIARWLLLFLRLGFPGVLVHAKAEATLPVETLRVFFRIQLEPHQPVDAE
eukprot:scaffold38990_cov75-Phaeocystis_antarctica.AAC.1